MLKRFGVYRAFAVTTAFVLPLLCAHTPTAFAADDDAPPKIPPVVFSYSGQVYGVTEAQSAALTALAAQVNRDQKFVVVLQAGTAGMPKASLSYVIEQDRLLTLFLALVGDGVDPSRIVFEALPSHGKKSGKLNAVLRPATAPEDTAEITPASAEKVAKGLPRQMVIHFAPRSAEPTDLDAVRLLEFLAAVGQPGYDAVAIAVSGKLKSSYDKALGELRALTVYERLVRTGLKANRVAPQSGLWPKCRTDCAKAADDSITISWVQDAKFQRPATK